MLQVMAERAGNRLAEITMDQAIRELKVGRDWGAFLEFLTGLFEMLMPIFDKCLVSADLLTVRAGRWGEVINLGRRERRRKLGFLENIMLSLWERQVSRGIDNEVGDEFNNREIAESILYAIANSTPEEVTELRAESARLREAAA